MWNLNPEAGYFGVVPGTNPKTNRNAYDMIQSETIFTNVGLTKDNQPWWENKKTGQPDINWLGKKYDKEEGPAAHPNSRFTVSAKNNASYSRLAESPEGVPISAIVFGGRRKELAPLVYEAKSWQHGVLIGASVASETTAAAIGDVGVIRRDPMAMKPFCGYNFADYWQHWLSFSDRTEKLPKIFHVNWFRQDILGKFLWPGFGENLRVLRWIIDRCENQVDAQDTAIGYLPHTKDINTDDLDISNETMKELLSVKKESWIDEMKSVREYLQSYGERLPNALLKNQEEVLEMLMD